MTQASLAETASGYRHEAFLYSGPAEFLAGTMSFIRRAIRAASASRPCLDSRSTGKGHAVEHRKPS